MRYLFSVASVVLLIAMALTAVITAQSKPQSDTAQEAEANETQEKDQASSFEPPSPPASGQRTEERRRMVETQIASSRNGRLRIRDERVLAAMRTAPRHVFVPESIRSRAYDDTPLPIGYGQTISQPYIVALMTELLELTPESRVLEIGTGSAYQAAVLAQCTPYVYTIEIIEPLAERAETVLRSQGYDTVATRQADGYHGWPEAAPFDGIIVTCASGHLPPPLWEQLKPGGRIVIPIGGPYELQRLIVMTKNQDGTRRSRTVISVRFVPMTRKESS